MNYSFWNTLHYRLLLLTTCFCSDEHCLITHTPTPIEHEQNSKCTQTDLLTSDLQKEIYQLRAENAGLKTELSRIKEFFEIQRKHAESLEDQRRFLSQQIGPNLMT